MHIINTAATNWPPFRGQHFQFYSLHKNCYPLIQIWLKCISCGPNNNKPALVGIIALLPNTNWNNDGVVYWHICIYVNKLGHHWFSTCLVPSHYRNQWGILAKCKQISVNFATKYNNFHSILNELENVGINMLTDHKTAQHDKPRPLCLFHLVYYIVYHMFCSHSRIGKPDHRRSPLVFFHPIGLAGTDGVKASTDKTLTVGGIMERLGHKDVSS